MRTIINAETLIIVRIHVFIVFLLFLIASLLFIVSPIVCQVFALSSQAEKFNTVTFSPNFIFFRLFLKASLLFIVTPSFCQVFALSPQPEKLNTVTFSPNYTFLYDRIQSARRHIYVYRYVYDPSVRPQTVE